MTTPPHPDHRHRHDHSVPPGRRRRRPARARRRAELEPARVPRPSPPLPLGRPTPPPPRRPGGGAHRLHLRPRPGRRRVASPIWGPTSTWSAATPTRCATPPPPCGRPGGGCHERGRPLRPRRRASAGRRDRRRPTTAVDVLVHNAGALDPRVDPLPPGHRDDRGHARSWARSCSPACCCPRWRPRPTRAGCSPCPPAACTPSGSSSTTWRWAPDDYDGRARLRPGQAGPGGANRELGRPGPGAAWRSTRCTRAGPTRPGVVSGLPRFHTLARPILRTPEEGADTLVWLAAAPGADLGASGGFWLDRRRRSTEKLPWTRTPPGERDRLWAWCEQRAGRPRRSVIRKTDQRRSLGDSRSGMN